MATRKCPVCEAEIDPNAFECEHCGYSLTSTPSRVPPPRRSSTPASPAKESRPPGSDATPEVARRGQQVEVASAHLAGPDPVEIPPGAAREESPGVIGRLKKILGRGE